MPVYRDFLDMLFSMRLPILGLGIVFVGVCILTALEFDDPVFAALAALGALTTSLRLSMLQAYARTPPLGDKKSLRRWERRYAMGAYASAVLLGVLNVAALTIDYPVLHMITVSLVFGFCAGVVARISVRPTICIASLMLATVPTVVALALRALEQNSGPLNMEMSLMEAVLIAMITGLSLQTVSHLYNSAVEHHTARHDLARLAKLDALTGLANRLLLRERFQASVASMDPVGGRLAVHFLDLDGFKAVNDWHGHPVGDALLVQVARRLETMVRTEDTVARLGGDEFVIVQSGLRHGDEAEMLARRIVRQLSLPYDIDDLTVCVSVSVGISLAPDQGLELERLLSCADAALYRAKAGGKAQAIFCTDDDIALLDLAA